MTPPCCTRAWAKAHNTKAVTCDRSSFCDEGWYPETAEFMHSTHAHGMSGIPDAESAEWLADCIKGLLLTGWNVELGIYLGTPFARLTRRLTDPQVVKKATGWDEFSALCAALNGSPCERKAA